MFTNIKDIAITLGIDEKIVAEIYKEWFDRWLEAKEREENIPEIRKEIINKIYN